MNSRSEQYTSHCVRTPLTLRLPCLVFVLLLLPCIYCFFPLLLSDRPDDRCRRPCDRLRRRRQYLYRRASRQAEPFSSQDIAYLFRTFLALGIVTAAAT